MYSGGKYFLNGIQITKEEHDTITIAASPDNPLEDDDYPSVKKNKEDSELLRSIGLDIDYEFNMMYSSQIVELFSDEEKLMETLRKFKLRVFI
jgi:hypothetical protein